MTREEKIQQILAYLQIEGNTKALFIALVTQNLPNVEEAKLDMLLSIFQAEALKNGQAQS